ncbi:J domain-containing protein [Limibacter armeniacum]|uniref:J domain-containing protein n=1 Tax=Limibacter armeniacum TaxID=466084 RepID=UPI002FE637FA
MNQKNKLLRVEQKDKQKSLSKAQQEFNRLTKRIDTLQKGILKETEKMEAFLQLYLSDYAPSIKEVAKLQAEMATQIHLSTEQYKYTKKQLENIREVITFLLDEAFAELEPEPSLTDIYDQWSSITYEESLEADKEHLQDLAKSMFSQAFGEEIDLPDFETATPEDFKAFEEMLLKKSEATFEKQQAAQKAQKKTPKQLEKEALQQEDEKNRLKSLKSLYHSLAKLLHPDKENSEVEKEQREELMKQVSEAYKQKDLPTLLRLEMEWLRKESNHLETLTDQQLSLYNQTLQEQTWALFQEKSDVPYDPRYIPVRDYSLYTLKSGLKEMKQDIKENQQRIQMMKEDLGAMHTKKGVLYVIEVIENTIEAIDQQRSFDLFGFNDFFR